MGWETVEDENLTVVIARNSGIHRDEGSYCKCSERRGFDWLALFWAKPNNHYSVIQPEICVVKESSRFALYNFIFPRCLPCQCFVLFCFSLV